MSEVFDWNGISPTIFGVIFESTFNPDMRRKGGIHYTSIENIHRVIDPLFLDRTSPMVRISCEKLVMRIPEKVREQILAVRDT